MIDYRALEKELATVFKRRGIHLLYLHIRQTKKGQVYYITTEMSKYDGCP